MRQGLRKGHWSQLRFRGDEMLRPVTSQEIGWLAVVLVRLSMRVNHAIGLDGGAPTAQDEQPDNVFQVGHHSIRFPMACDRVSLQRLSACCSDKFRVVSRLIIIIIL